MPGRGGSGPALPSGRRVHLPGRGTTFVREVTGPPGAPTVILLHGWIASAGLNWFTTFDALGRHFRVLALDQRGHGRGIRSRHRFRLADCADDVSALAHELGVRRAIVVGYSMGGPVAQLVWRRDPNLVDGLVLAATGDCFVDRRRDRLVFTSLMAAAAGTSGLADLVLRLPVTRARQLGRPTYRRARSLQRWALEEMARHDWTTVFQAGQALGNYDARRWISAIDVPTGVLITATDKALPPEGQFDLAARIADASVHTVDGGHTVCAQPHFGPAVLEACLAVAERVAQPQLS
jgi:pimeloyl-ACP methyl ester carboxylesterase